MSKHFKQIEESEVRDRIWNEDDDLSCFNIDGKHIGLGHNLQVEDARETAYVYDYAHGFFKKVVDTLTDEDQVPGTYR